MTASVAASLAQQCHLPPFKEKTEDKFVRSQPYQVKEKLLSNHPV